MRGLHKHLRELLELRELPDLQELPELQELRKHWWELRDLGALRELRE